MNFENKNEKTSKEKAKKEKHNKKPGVQKLFQLPPEIEDNSLSSKSPNDQVKKLINLKDFPALVSPTNSKTEASDKNNEKALASHSWLSALNRKNEKSNCNEKLSDLECSKNEDNLLTNNIINNLKPICKQDSSVSKKSEKNKTKNPKNNAALPPKNPNKKKRSSPILINLVDIANISKAQKKTKPGKGIISKFHKNITKERLSGNILDSSNPKRSRGKHRENKIKKLSNLKTKIIKERILKQKAKEKYCGLKNFNEYINLEDNINFKLEIEKYLKDLDKTKLIQKNKTKENFEENADEKKKVVNEKIHEKTENFTQSSVKDQSSCKIKNIQFSSKLREYCDNLITPTLNLAVSELVKNLVTLQDRAFSRDPIRAKAKRRHVSGIKEVKKYFTLKKIKMVIIPPNLEKLKMEGSVFDLIYELKSFAESQNVPCVFALDRFKLGRCAKKGVPVSAFGVINYEGIEDKFNNVIQELREAKESFNKVMRSEKENNECDADFINHKLSSTLMAVFRENLSDSFDQSVEQKDQKERNLI